MSALHMKIFSVQLVVPNGEIPRYTILACEGEDIQLSPHQSTHRGGLSCFQQAATR